MFSWFKARRRSRASAKQLYGSSVAQARQEVFYAHWGVPDTVEGRYEMITVHLYLLHKRLQREDAAGHELSRAVLETFMTDLDDNMREQGVSDTKVPRRIKKAAAGIYDRFQAYDAAMEAGGDGDTDALAVVLKENFLAYQASIAADATSNGVAPIGVAPKDVAPNVLAITRYMRQTVQSLDRQAAGELLAGTVEYPALEGSDKQGFTDGR